MPLNLKVTLAARGKSQEDLAADLGVEPTNLNRIINGRREADPSLRRHIAEALNADEKWLFHEPLPPSKSKSVIPLPTANSCIPPDAVTQAEDNQRLGGAEEISTKDESTDGNGSCAKHKH